MLLQDLRNDVIKWKHFRTALLALCARNSPVTGEFPSQRPFARNFDVFFDLCLNKRFSKQLWGWWFETASYSLWRHFNVARWVRQLDTNYVSNCKIYRKDSILEVLGWYLICWTSGLEPTLVRTKLPHLTRWFKGVWLYIKMVHKISNMFVSDL